MKKNKIMFKKILPLLLCSTLAMAQWSPGDATPNPVSTAPDLQTDAAFGIDEEGNSVYFFLDYNGSGVTVKAQKLDINGKPLWQANGVTIGSACSEKVYQLIKKEYCALDNGFTAFVWHKIPDSGNPDVKELWINVVNKDGQVLFNQGRKVNDYPIFNKDVNEAVTLIYNSDAAIGLVYDSYDPINNTEKLIGGSLEFNFPFLNTALSPLVAQKVLNTVVGDKNKVAYDKTNARVGVLYQNSTEDYLGASYDKYFLDEVIAPKKIFNNPFNGGSRIDLFKYVKGEAIIGRTLSGGGMNRVIAQKLDKDFTNKWNGGVVQGTNTGFDVQLDPNEDGGGTMVWVEPNEATARMMATRFNSNGQVIWSKPVLTAASGVYYITPNKFASDGAGGSYSLLFKEKSGGFNLHVQHLDGNGNQAFGPDGIAIEGFNWFNNYRLIPHPYQGVIALYSASADADINKGESYDMFTSYLGMDGNFGIIEPFSVVLDRTSFCPSEEITLSVGEGKDLAEYEFTFVSLTNDSVVLTINENGKFHLPAVASSGYIYAVKKSTGQISDNRAQIEIKSLAKPDFSASGIYCHGSTELFSTSCESGTVYWSTGDSLENLTLTFTESTELYATCVKAGCENSENSDTSIITVEKVDATASSNSPLYVGGNLNLIASGGINYSWTGPDSFTSSSAAVSIPQVTLANAGVYSVTVSSERCTASASTTVTVLEPLAVSPIEAGAAYPNPVKDVLNIENLREGQLIDGNGRVLMTVDHQSSVQMGVMKPGVYYLKGKTKTGEQYSQKIIKE